MDAEVKFFQIYESLLNYGDRIYDFTDCHLFVTSG